MRIETKDIKIYKFSEASEELKDKIREASFWRGWQYEHSFIERLDTLKKVAEILDGDLDYRISYTTDIGEFIKIRPNNDELNFAALWEVMNQEKECPFTGVYYDHDIIDQFTKYNLNANKLQEILDDYIESIHKEYEDTLTDEYLTDLCDANDYEFTDDGKMY